MILTRGVKPVDLDIKKDVPYRIERTGDYIEIEINDPVEIAKLRAKGFSDL